MDRGQLFHRIHRIAGGRQVSVRIPDSALHHPRTARDFRWITWLLVAELVIGAGVVVVAVWMAATGHEVPFSAWMRSVVVLGMTATLFYFAARAAAGWRWAYQRLRLFSQIFPVITLVLTAIPGLYPVWMITEQIVFSLLMIGIADILTSDHMRVAYRRLDRPLPHFE